MDKIYQKRGQEKVLLMISDEASQELESLKNTVASLKEDLSKIKEDVNNQETVVEQVTNISNSINNINSDVTNINSSVTDINNEQTNIKNSLSSIEENIKTLSSRIEELEEEISKSWITYIEVDNFPEEGSVDYIELLNSTHDGGLVSTVVENNEGTKEINSLYQKIKEGENFIFKPISINNKGNGSVEITDGAWGVYYEGVLPEEDSSEVSNLLETVPEGGFIVDDKQGSYLISDTDTKEWVTYAGSNMPSEDSDEYDVLLSRVPEGGLMFDDSE